MKEVLLFGSTGSIGRNSLKVLEQVRFDYNVKGLCTYGDTETLFKQIKKFSPKYVCVVNEEKAHGMKGVLPKGTVLLTGARGLEEFSALSSDVSLMAITGISCLAPLLKNLKTAKRIALANKESIVTAGKIVFEQAARFATEIIPVDSEINALYQLIKGHTLFKKLYLTASGGALIDYNTKDLKAVTLQRVLNHPTWKMGKRVTVDSATLVNKGFEVVETHHFFNTPYEAIGILLHRESAIHALLESGDGSLLACLYPPDMRTPIAYALLYPKCVPCARRFDFKNKLSFSFEPLVIRKFPLLQLILETARRQDNGLVVLNACDEVAVQYFIKKKIKFVEIIRVMEHLFEHYPRGAITKIEDVYYWDSWARKKTEEYLLALCA